jgi:OCT family organic anion transporter-like MFS transporter 23
MAAGRQEAPDHQPENGFTPLDHTPPRLLPQIDASVLPSLGGFGKHQKQHVVLTWIPALFIGFSQFSDYFLLAQPNGTCVHPPANDSSWTGAPPLLAAPGGTPAFHLGSNETGESYSGGMAMLCACKEWKLELLTGLSQNVVTKVTNLQIAPHCISRIDIFYLFSYNNSCVHNPIPHPTHSAVILKITSIL